ncbi:hypothetical protein ASPZODRAFT_752405 [Penicilliopsis zonata CBS 506.65]|uniref:Uncharacterized protein n=1 Tax=Penicilliopsis zonata CBS 506.65 TaxID=1073090 RepID=A0A1L9SAT8_9EURO|nr:hypothetical protein ASPZODRAFT_752405 [Penicilliopsis zonata CBS 506.65]OJJ44237.1 hypothetical protein ASPZODRAFT_752405 [Penicilliopsis zonata CBS 506.65]
MTTPTTEKKNPQDRQQTQAWDRQGQGALAPGGVFFCCSLSGGCLESTACRKVEATRDARQPDRDTRATIRLPCGAALKPGRGKIPWNNDNSLFLFIIADRWACLLFDNGSYWIEIGRGCPLCTVHCTFFLRRDMPTHPFNRQECLQAVLKLYQIPGRGSQIIFKQAFQSGFRVESRLWRSPS